jgi:Ca2+-binding RTX toxin-like protein
MSISDFAKLTAADLSVMSKFQATLLTSEYLAALTKNNISGLAANVLKYIPSDALVGITPSAIAGLPPAFISLLTLDQVHVLTTDQLSSLSLQQLNAFSPNQVSELSSHQIESFNARKEAVLNNSATDTSTDIATTLSGSDLLDNIGTVGQGDSAYLDDAINTYLAFDPSLTAVMANYASEEWSAVAKGSDNYDSNLTTLQTIKLKSNENSLLTFTQQNDDKVSSSSYDFISSDKKITLNSVSSKKDSGSDLTNSTYKFSYKNIDDTGNSDDINATQSETKSEKKTLKNSLWTSNETGSYALNYVSENYKVNISKTKIEKSTYSDDSVDSNNYTSSSHETTTISKYSFASLENGFSISFTGTSTKDYKDDIASEKVLLNKVILNTNDYKATTAKSTYNSILDENGDLHSITNATDTNVSIDKMQEDIEKYVVPNLMSGDNSITIVNRGIQIDAGAGKDTVIGGTGDDTIIGGAGSDKLTSGKGADTFSFSNADFYTENANGDSVFNKSTDTITDFNLEHDVLDFGDLGELSFYAKLADAKADNAHLFYVKGSGSIYLNTSTTDGFTPTVIITLIGKPAVNADLTDWNYPV